MFPSWLFSRIQEYANYLNYLHFIIMSKVLDVIFRDPSSFPPQTYTALGSSKEIPPGLSCGWWVYVEWGWGERIRAGFGVFHLMSPRSPEMLLIWCWEFAAGCPFAPSPPPKRHFSGAKRSGWEGRRWHEVASWWLLGEEQQPMDEVDAFVSAGGVWGSSSSL